ncbi:hypothetical protein, partial [Pantoea sp.]|uniref:hypothetical protein n=1 Tax=Pantoea sp. TaxID=69393 RepID=UPI0028AFAE44
MDKQDSTAIKQHYDDLCRAGGCLGCFFIAKCLLFTRSTKKVALSQFFAINACHSELSPYN